MASDSRIVVPGRIVHFVFPHNNYEGPAIISGTADSTDGSGMEPEGDGLVHLHVFDPSDDEDVPAVDVWFDIAHDRSNKPGTYHWQDECRRT